MIIDLVKSKKFDVIIMKHKSWLDLYFSDTIVGNIFISILMAIWLLMHEKYHFYSHIIFFLNENCKTILFMGINHYDYCVWMLKPIYKSYIK